MDDLTKVIALKGVIETFTDLLVKCEELRKPVCVVCNKAECDPSCEVERATLALDFLKNKLV